MVDKTTEKKKKIKGFKEFDSTKYVETEPVLDEATKGTVVVAWGRMNPMTAGHEKLVKKVISVAKSEKAQPEVYLTHSFDKKKNPLSYDDKIKLAQKAFGPTVKKSNAKTIFQLMAQLNTKYNRVVLIAGSDRVEEFRNTLQKYNGKEYNFDEIKVVSAGARDPDADDVSGISGTKMREFAVNDTKKFAANLPDRLKGDAESIAALVKKGMGMNEETDLDEALNRAQRIKRARAMRRARFKIRRGKEKAERKTAPVAVLRRRARKAAIKLLKKKFSKSRDYADMSAGEKEIIDKRIERISKKRIEAIAKKLLPKVRKQDRERLSARRKAKNESLNTRFENFLAEASYVDTKVRKKPHMLLGDDKKTKIDRRFRMFKNKVNESAEELIEDLASFTLDMDAYIDSLEENYYKGVPKDKKDDRKAHFKRYAEKPGDGADKDSNYKPAPGDFKDGKRVKTKLSQHTKNYRAMYGEETEISEDATTALKNKAEKTGMPLSVLRKVYNRGVAAWKSGHRPGTTPEQWGHARVNSFVTKGSGTWGKADKDLAAKVRKEDFSEAKIPHALDPNKSLKRARKDRGIDWDNDGDVDSLDKKHMLPDEITGAEKKDLTPTARKKNAAELKHIKKGVAYEEAGAGEWGTPKLTKRYRKDTPYEKAKNEEV